MLCFSIFSPVVADSKLVATQEDGIAIGGYDPVSFHQQSGPVMGTHDHILMWQGATWLFVSAKNMERFEANPRAFAPRFGGYCAFGLSVGTLVQANPQAWVLRDDGLYLFKDQLAAEVWLEDADNRINLAKGKWPRILRE